MFLWFCGKKRKSDEKEDFFPLWLDVVKKDTEINMSNKYIEQIMSNKFTYRRDKHECRITVLFISPKTRKEIQSYLDNRKSSNQNNKNLSRS